MDRTANLPPERADFLRRLQNGTCSHAFIVEGPKGSGKREFALWCAGALLCESEHQAPCGVCRSCKKVAKGHHPDLHLYGEGEKAITVGEVRNIIHETGLVPVDGERIVFVLANAQRMQAPAQNALLKVFEEPPNGVVIFLLTEARRALLPTVRSRGQAITLSALSDAEMERALRDRFLRLPADELAAAVRVARGSLGEAVDFLSKEAAQNRIKAREWLHAAFGNDKYRLVSLISMPKFKREQAIAQTDAFLRLLFDLLLIKTGARAVLLSEEDAAELGGRATRRALAAMCEVTLESRERLEANGNVTAVMTNLASGLWSAAN